MKKLIISLFCLTIFSLFSYSANAGIVDDLIKESWRVKAPYDTTEKFLLGGVYLTQIGDYKTTKDAFSRGCIEGNDTFYGSNPDDGALIAGKIITSLVITWASNNITNHTVRKVMLGAGTLFGGAVMYHNSTIECR